MNNAKTIQSIQNGNGAPMKPQLMFQIVSGPSNEIKNSAEAEPIIHPEIICVNHSKGCLLLARLRKKTPAAPMEAIAITTGAFCDHVSIIQNNAKETNPPSTQGPVRNDHKLPTISVQTSPSVWEPIEMPRTPIPMVGNFLRILPRALLKKYDANHPASPCRPFFTIDSNSPLSSSERFTEYSSCKPADISSAFPVSASCRSL